ncbi:hypothetical protein GCM10007907_30130 [Chitinimonas prasina]|uniref:Uncharacterized protein n=1 Tax=Chitinimonas prasina TaxID=1434937 RepID=A0ABQ5YJT4_9NEIS|nr:hypothetical protein GCM10007907_30130 [Chitinimonas prasina]
MGFGDPVGLAWTLAAGGGGFYQLVFGVPLQLQHGAVLAAATALFYQSAVAVIAVALVLKDGDTVVLERAVAVGRQQVVGGVELLSASSS